MLLARQASLREKYLLFPAYNPTRFNLVGLYAQQHTLPFCEGSDPHIYWLILILCPTTSIIRKP
jgi:hypothetical protein